jgi:glucose-6-phosphate 1-dehydrogenase
MPATTVVLFGATGDLAKRKLLPGMLHLHESQLLEGLRVVATSLDELTREEFLDLVSESVRKHSRREVTDEDLREFADRIHWVPGSAGTPALVEAVAESEQILGPEARRLHYLSVPPNAAMAVVHQIAEAGLVERSRIVMEKPFGTDLASARKLNAELHEVFTEEQIFRIDHFLGKEAAQNILAFRFANGLFEPIWHRNHIDHVQIDVPEVLGIEQRADFYEATGAYRDMIVTHLFQVLGFTAMEPPPRGGRGARVRDRDVRRHQVLRRQLAVGGRAVLPADRQAHGGGRPHHLHRLQGTASDDVPARLGGR